MNYKAKHDFKNIIIFGAGGHAASVANVAISAGYEISCFVDKNKYGNTLLGIKIIADICNIENISDYNYSIAIGGNALRQKIYNELILKEKLTFPALIHSSATISSFSSIGNGTVVMPNAIVGPNSVVGKFCILNTQSSIDHDCIMADFSSLAPGAITGGSVKIGLRSAISIGSIVKNDIEIGDDSILGSNSYLNKNLISNKIAYGTPAKDIRERNSEDEYLK